MTSARKMRDSFESRRKKHIERAGWVQKLVGWYWAWYLEITFHDRVTQQPVKEIFQCLTLDEAFKIQLALEEMKATALLTPPASSAEEDSEDED